MRIVLQVWPIPTLMPLDLTCYMYKSSLRHIHDPVLSSLKMEGIRLLFHYKMHLKVVPARTVTLLLKASNKIGLLFKF
jgi:hypothetical protein